MPGGIGTGLRRASRVCIAGVAVIAATTIGNFTPVCGVLFVLEHTGFKNDQEGDGRTDRHKPDRRVNTPGSAFGTPIGASPGMFLAGLLERRSVVSRCGFGQRFDHRSWESIVRPITIGNGGRRRQRHRR